MSRVKPRLLLLQSWGSTPHVLYPNIFYSMSPVLRPTGHFSHPLPLCSGYLIHFPDENTLKLFSIMTTSGKFINRATSGVGAITPCRSSMVINSWPALTQNWTAPATPLLSTGTGWMNQPLGRPWKRTGSFRPLPGRNPHRAERAAA